MKLHFFHPRARYVGIHETDTTKNRQTNVHKQKVSRSELPKCGIHPRSSARETSLCSNPGLETWKPRACETSHFFHPRARYVGIHETDTTKNRQTNVHKQKVSRSELPKCGIHPRSSARETSLCSNPGLETWKPKRQRKKQKETETGTQRQTDRLQEQKVSRGVLRVWGLKGLGS